MAISWDPTKTNISQVTLPSGDVVYIKDAEARAEIDKLASYTEFLGVTTTAIQDGTTSAVVVIDGDEVTAKKGDIVIYNKVFNAGTLQEYTVAQEFIYDGTQWSLFGDLSATQLGDLAYYSSTKADYTPSGSVSVQLSIPTNQSITVSGDVRGEIVLSDVSDETASTSYAPTGSISVQLSIPEDQSITVSGDLSGCYIIANNEHGTYTPSGSVSVTLSIPASQHIEVSGTIDSRINATVSSEGNYTPSGTIEASVYCSTMSVLTGVSESGQLPSLNGDIYSITVNTATENLVFSVVSNAFSAGTMPTFSSDFAAYSASAVAVFTGNTVELGFDDGATITCSGTFTPSVTVSSATLIGNQATFQFSTEGRYFTFSGSFTPSIVVSSAAFFGDTVYVGVCIPDLSLTGNFTPDVEVSSATFTGTSASIIASGYTSN